MGDTTDIFPGVVMGFLIVFMIIVAGAALMNNRQKAEADKTPEDPILDHFTGYDQYHRPLLQKAMTKINQAQFIVSHLHKDAQLGAEEACSQDDASLADDNHEAHLIKNSKQHSFEVVEDILFLNHCVLEKILHDNQAIIQSRTAKLNQAQEVLDQVNAKSLAAKSSKWAKLNPASWFKSSKNTLNDDGSSLNSSDLESQIEASVNEKSKMMPEDFELSVNNTDGWLHARLADDHPTKSSL
ncbi:hypothetical protein NADFUDRAFT_46060 [Nadsonia fulvescens var. elongata DSM 6958]|uniref:Uncharacterized protein n=1 Tax=Nadsonia fulvescens var. elongata DSM 6958 TaxID=857566 RepID=A0A1E3PMJ5_9ASCO|nr:hypothetical protein NADFUDRAFT_46060 [Nadsonia fulvescens var. elongata DSM 6958]